MQALGCSASPRRRARTPRRAARRAQLVWRRPYSGEAHKHQARRWKMKFTKQEACGSRCSDRRRSGCRGPGRPVGDRQRVPEHLGPEAARPLVPRRSSQRLSPQGEPRPVRGWPQARVRQVRVHEHCLDDEVRASAPRAPVRCRERVRPGETRLRPEQPERALHRRCGAEREPPELLVPRSEPAVTSTWSSPRWTMGPTLSRAGTG